MPSQLRTHDAIRKDVREKMAQNKLSQRDLVEITKLARFTIANFLKGRSKPHDHTLIKLCMDLGIPWYESAEA